jgi:hypothetical protein
LQEVTGTRDQQVETSDIMRIVHPRHEVQNDDNGGMFSKYRCMNEFACRNVEQGLGAREWKYNCVACCWVSQPFSLPVAAHVSLNKHPKST